MSSDSEDDVPLASRSKVLVSNGKNGDAPQIAAAAEVPNASKVVQVKKEAPDSGSVAVKKEGESAAPSTKPPEIKSASIPAKGLKREHNETATPAPKEKKPEPVAGTKVKREEPVTIPKKAGVAQKKTAAPPAKKVKTESAPTYSSSNEGESESSSESDDSSDSDDEPLSNRVKKRVKKAPKPAAKKTPTPKTPQTTSKAKSVRMWETLQHSGVLFPPAYEPHGVPLYYDGEEVLLTPEEEEVASMFAIMKDTDYAAKMVFVKNFFNDFIGVLTPANKKLIKKFSLLDFTKIYLHLAQVRFDGGFEISRVVHVGVPAMGGNRCQTVDDRRMATFSGPVARVLL
eukprot:6903378-Pyramimonas_sp.AAC.2